MPSPSGTDAAPTRPSPPHRPGGKPPDPVLAAERDYLRQSREYLRLMRENVLSLRAMGGDPVSEEYLKADLYRRAEVLRDIPDAPLFFGRLDYAAGSVWSEDGEGGEAGGQVETAHGRRGSDRFHIGRRHVHDLDGHPVVIDWRAPVSRAFYRASQADPMSLERRRRFGFSGGDLTAYEDEAFGAPGVRPDGPQTSRIMLEEIERPRSGPMRDIVATIQPDQDDIVRGDADATVCVQGAPGTGKTAVGLHRVAYLLYAHANRMKRGGVLVVGPNRAFLAYIRNVLPALGEVGVDQVTVADLVGTVTVRASDSERAARIKGDARMAEVLRRALWAGVAEPAEGLMVARGSRRWRVSREEIAGLIDELRERGVRHGAGRDMLGHRIAHVVLTRMEAAGEAPDDRTHDAVRRTREVRSAGHVRKRSDAGARRLRRPRCPLTRRRPDPGRGERGHGGRLPRRRPGLRRAGGGERGGLRHHGRHPQGDHAPARPAWHRALPVRNRPRHVRRRQRDRRRIRLHGCPCVGRDLASCAAADRRVHLPQYQRWLGRQIAEQVPYGGP